MPLLVHPGPFAPVRGRRDPSGFALGMTERKKALGMTERKKALGMTERKKASE
jgi:hypothetical protein